MRHAGVTGSDTHTGRTRLDAAPRDGSHVPRHPTIRPLFALFVSLVHAQPGPVVCDAWPPPGTYGAPPTSPAAEPSNAAIKTRAPDVLIVGSLADNPRAARGTLLALWADGTVVAADDRATPGAGLRVSHVAPAEATALRHALGELVDALPREARTVDTGLIVARVWDGIRHSTHRWAPSDKAESVSRLEKLLEPYYERRGPFVQDPQAVNEALWDFAWEGQWNAQVDVRPSDLLHGSRVPVLAIEGVGGANRRVRGLVLLAWSDGRMIVARDYQNPGRGLIEYHLTPHEVERFLSDLAGALAEAVPKAVPSKSGSYRLRLATEGRVLVRELSAFPSRVATTIRSRTLGPATLRAPSDLGPGASEPGRRDVRPRRRVGQLSALKQVSPASPMPRQCRIGLRPPRTACRGENRPLALAARAGPPLPRARRQVAGPRGPRKLATAANPASTTARAG